MGKMHALLLLSAIALMGGAGPGGSEPVVPPGCQLDDTYPSVVIGRPDFARVENAPTTKARLDITVAYLRGLLHGGEEVRMGAGGGPISASGHEGTMMAVAKDGLDRGEVAAARANEHDPALRDRLTVLLGLCGDKSVVPQLLEFLAHHPDSGMRWASGLALEVLRDPTSIGALQLALKDRYAGVNVGGFGKSATKVYTVRSIARDALWALGVRVDESVTCEPRHPKDRVELMSYMLEDKEPQACAEAVTLLSREGEAARPYLEAFVKENEANKDLAASVRAAQEILAKPGQAGK